jgi:hypothetical protein
VVSFIHSPASSPPPLCKRLELQGALHSVATRNLIKRKLIFKEKKGDKTACSHYRGISLLSTSYKILYNILLSRLSAYTDEIIGDHQCGFRRNRSTTDQIFCIHRILKKKWECNGTVYQLLIDFKKTIIQLGGKYCTIFFLICIVGAESTLGPHDTSVIYPWPIVPAPSDCEDGEFGEMNWQGKPKYSEKTCPGATLSTTNPT